MMTKERCVFNFLHQYPKFKNSAVLFEGILAGQFSVLNELVFAIAIEQLFSERSATPKIIFLE
jgi:hypothetical protein